MDEIFGTRGLIAKHHKDYEFRAGQIKMAEAVLRAFEEKKHLIVEAGTGTGKTMAYLVPAIAAAVASNKRVIISTGTKNLQEQLMEKDIPFLQKIMPKKFTAAYMKGRSNYACLYKIKKAESQPILEGLDVLILDCLRPRPHATHFSLEEAVEMAQRLGAKRTLFTHMSHELEHESTNATLPPGMQLAHDGLRVPLS